MSIHKIIKHAVHIHKLKVRNKQQEQLLTKGKVKGIRDTMCVINSMVLSALGINSMSE